MPDGQIFKATYSGIPVYEMMCKGVAVMRRRSDSWLNATQILKVAGFDKPQRTRVLEREVQKGEHEKVQGGYGKYQGTWIPLERGLELAKQYNCDTLLRAIMEFQPAAKSPPLAPKHLVSTANARPTRRNATAAATSTTSTQTASAPTVNTRSSRRQAPSIIENESELETTLTAKGSEDESMTPSPSEASSSSRTPSPIRSPSPPNTSNGNMNGRVATPSRRSKKMQSTEDLRENSGPSHSSKNQNGLTDARVYGDQVLEYFISDSTQVPHVLVSPPADFDPNMAIDDDGHTSLHWACAMGRIRIVKLLLTAGADIFKVNKAGQTALMRSVMFGNNYDVRKFPELYEHLHRSTLNIDNYNRTVFHHIVDVAMSKGKTHAARYYMETILGRLAEFPKELMDVVNFQDQDGETALTMAARCRSKRLVKILIDHGADPKLINHDGKSTEDYILEDEKFRSSPVPPSRVTSMSFRNAQAASYHPLTLNPSFGLASTNGDRPPLHHSMTAQKASTRCVNDMASMLDSLAASFDQELKEKERDTSQAHALLANIQAEILESQRAVGHLKQQAAGLTQAKEHLTRLEEELLAKMGKRYRLGWEKWVKDDELREKGVRDKLGGALLQPALGTHDGGRNIHLGDISDLVALHENIPSDPEQLQRACGALREDISQYRKRRKTMFGELAAFQAEAGTGGRMGDYRKLIGAGCGGIPAAEVDQIIGMLLETLEAEEPSSSSTAWSGSSLFPAVQ